MPASRRLAAAFCILLATGAGATETPPPAAPPPQAAARILAAGHLRCAVVDAALDWNKTDLHGNLSSFEAELCHALGAAMFGDASRADLQSWHSEDEALDGIRKGQTDVVFGVTPSAARAQHLGLRFSVPFFYDAQGFMVARDVKVHSLADIAGRKLCSIDDTENQSIAIATLAARGIRPVPFGFQEEGEMDAAIMDRHCEVASAMLTRLAEVRASFKDAASFGFLPELIAELPITAAAQGGDPRLAAIIDSTIAVLLQAEAEDITAATVRTAQSHNDPRRRRLLGEDWTTGAALGLAHDWPRQVIAATGNYAEIYNRTVGPGTDMNLPRGLNALWDHGGLMAPAPLQ